MSYRNLVNSPGYSSHIGITETGQFYADSYVHDDTHEFCSTIYVWPGWVPFMKQRISASGKLSIESDDQLLDAIAGLLRSKADIEKWLSANRIPFAERYDDGARLGAPEGPMPEEPAAPPPGPPLRAAG